LKERIEIPKDVAASVLVASARTCCVCNEPDKEVQIHHIDGDPSNNDPANLAVVCFVCHDKTQIRGGFGRKLDAAQILKFKEDWEQRVRERKAKADEAAVAKLVGATSDRPTSTPERRDRIPNEDRLVSFIKLRPAMKKDVHSRARKEWDKGNTASQVRGYREYIDVFRQILVTLCGWFPPNHFSETGVEDFIDTFVSFSYRRHRALEEPLGYGTGGTMVRVLVASAAMKELDEFIADVARSLIWRTDGGIDPREWESAWKSAENGPDE
jgi:hypothetical protein